MSRMELNKGVLKILHSPVEELAERYVSGESWSEYYESKVDALESDPGEYGLAKIGETFYQEIFEIKGGDMEEGFAEVYVESDGNIKFHTYHYNGGAYYLELVEDALKGGNQ